MTTPKFDFSKLIADRVPLGAAGRAATRAKYDFGTGFPDPDSFPWQGLHEALGRALKDKGRDLVLYPDPQGHPELRQFIADKLKRERGMTVHPDQVLVTGGSGPAIALFVQLLTNPGDVLLTEEYTYVGTLGIMRNLKARIVGVATDEEGMRPDALEQTIKDLARFDVKPKMIYTIPSFQNPLGTDMGVARRKAILAVAQKYGVPIYEDDAYEDLRFEGQRPPAIGSYDDSGMVLYSGTFSKILGPAMRVGFLTAPQELLPRINSMHWGRPTSEFATLACLYYLRDHLDDHVDEINGILQSRRDSMTAAIGEYMGSAATVSHPDGGLYLWLGLPQGANTGAVAEKARARGVAYLPGPSFSPSGGGANYLRLCFGYENNDKIRDGIETLAKVFSEAGYLDKKR
ncbi:MAG: PLP-dependent aminotransferase family protein [Chloroflexi bacterium]|nr:PLP-dependent aminotransferase family protein [Chloroflexota bacterium]